MHVSLKPVCSVVEGHEMADSEPFSDGAIWVSFTATPDRSDVPVFVTLKE